MCCLFKQDSLSESIIVDKVLMYMKKEIGPRTEL